MNACGRRNDRNTRYAPSTDLSTGLGADVNL
jgi:hypothetical protein